MITTTEIRKRFLEFFRARQHEVIASSSLVPGNDNTLLFTNAGMVQFKDVFLGLDKRDYVRAVTSQRCVRAGGKHNDLENVGYTARHHTFFEMLGNFSFGDYFKESAILYAWEFLTEDIKLPKDKLWITVFEEDDEAYDLWAETIGVPEKRIARIGAKDNFWQMGDTGPCGPCSEIFYDHGPDIEGGPPGTPEEDGDRYIEIWNLVFMQYDRSADGTLTPLPKPSVDTGMGLERIAAVLQNLHNNYHIDLFSNLISSAAGLIGTGDLESSSLKVIVDHIRSCAFLIADGVVPSNEGRGYVLRRIIRRAARHGHKLGAQEPFFYKLVQPLAEQMGEAYPELWKKQNQIEKALLTEEEKFNATLASGMKILNEDIENLTSDTLSGELLFKLYDTYGFPVDLTADIARERGLQTDMEGFENAMEMQRQRARASNQFAADLNQRVKIDVQTEFTGYEDLVHTSSVSHLLHDNHSVESISEGQQAIVVLDTTPFYAESGGQVGDTGTLSNPSVQFQVEDTQKSGETFTHIGKLIKGELKLGDKLEAVVDADRRSRIVQNHSATHLLHAGLRRLLGEHVEQKGSLVNADYLRFDFSHSSPVKDDELAKIERWVNEQIIENSPSEVELTDMDSAMRKGAVALFGEKYGDLVRVISLGDHSTELCGGTHVNSTGDIGLFRIVSETGIASGIRRIEAVSGLAALDAAASDRAQISAISELLKTSASNIEPKVRQLLENSKKANRELQRLQSEIATQSGQQNIDQAVEVAGAKLLCLKVEDVDTKALREMSDRFRNKLGESIVVLASISGDKVNLVAGVDKRLTGKIKAGELVNFVANQVGGKGGGRPDMAMAGGDKPEMTDQALSSVKAWLEEKLG